MKDVNQQIAEAEAALAKLLKEKERQENLSEDEFLAEWLHGKFCFNDHTEYCGWYYDKDWSGSTKSKYLDKARRMLQVTDLQTVMKLMEVYKKI